MQLEQLAFSLSDEGRIPMNRVAAISILVACAIAAAAVAFMALQSDDVGEGSGSDDDKGDTGTIFARFNGNILKIDLADNSSSKALVDRLEEGDVTVDLEDYGGFEKSGDLGFTLPRNDKQMHTVSGEASYSIREERSSFTTMRTTGV